MGKLAKQPTLGVDMCEVEEITDSCGEELKGLIQLEENELCAKPESEALEKRQE
jgi:hypothetical protein